MSKNSFAEIVNSAKTMLSGVKANTERLAKRGLDQEFVTKLETSYTKTQELDNEQERLKARLKEKTEELNEELAQLKSLIAESKKIVKIEMEQSAWMEFGIDDKK